MPSVPITNESFPIGNLFGVVDGTSDLAFSLADLLHAAVSAGHNRDWHLILGAQVGGMYEFLWKAYALLLCVREESFSLQQNQDQLVDRFSSTERFWNLDSSEKRGATYHLGTSFALAWARKALNVPWLLHIDVYKESLNIEFEPGRSKPDLIGMDIHGRWVVIECKGRSSVPNDAAKLSAKAQSSRVVNIGGQEPSLSVAFFSFFGSDRSASGRRKPKILKGLAVDPRPDRNSEQPLELPLLTKKEFLRLYYEPFKNIFGAHNGAIVELDFMHSILFADLDLRISIDPYVRELIFADRYEEIPQAIIELKAKRETGLGDEKAPDDGIRIEAGESWKMRFKESR